MPLSETSLQPSNLTLTGVLSSGHPSWGPFIDSIIALRLSSSKASNVAQDEFLNTKTFILRVAIMVPTTKTAAKTISQASRPSHSQRTTTNVRLPHTIPSMETEFPALVLRILTMTDCQVPRQWEPIHWLDRVVETYILLTPAAADRARKPKRSSPSKAPMNSDINRPP